MIKERFNSYFYGVLGALFLFLSPRIFAESFYNQKDIVNRDQVKILGIELQNIKIPLINK